MDFQKAGVLAHHPSESESNDKDVHILYFTFFRFYGLRLLAFSDSEIIMQL
jgi:hypothetical protein